MGQFDFPDSEAERRGIENCDRVLREWKEKCQRKVEALGFSSWEEKDEHDEEQRRKEWEEYLRERGGPPTLYVPTREEREALELQARKSLASERAEKRASRKTEGQDPRLQDLYMDLEAWTRKGEEEGWGLYDTKLCKPCSCKEQVHPLFCTEELLSQKSMGDDPTQCELLQPFYLSDLKDVHTEETGPSKRFSEEDLPRFWGLPSQEKILRLPQWAKRDDIVQTMINTQEVDRTVYHGEYDPTRPIPSQSTTCSFVSLQETSADFRAFELQRERYGKRLGRSGTGRNVKQAMRTNTTMIDKAPAALPSATSVEPSPALDVQATRVLRQRASRGRGRGGQQVSRLQKNFRSRGLDIRKEQAGMGARTRQAMLSGKIQTRSRRTRNLFALDVYGYATRIANNRKV